MKKWLETRPCTIFVTEELATAFARGHRDANQQQQQLYGTCMMGTSACTGLAHEGHQTVGRKDFVVQRARKFRDLLIRRIWCRLEIGGREKDAQALSSSDEEEVHCPRKKVCKPNASRAAKQREIDWLPKVKGWWHQFVRNKEMRHRRLLCQRHTRKQISTILLRMSSSLFGLLPHMTSSHSKHWMIVSLSVNPTKPANCHWFASI